MSPPVFGLFGKLPWEGDFVQRGLPGRFVRPWDAWLSQSLADSRDVLGGGWADAYLLSPPWRFVIEPGIVDESGWCGVLISSIDRVRRYFPLTLALERPADEARVSQPLDLQPLLERLEAAALGLIATQQPIETMLAQTSRQMAADLAAMAQARPRSFALLDDPQAAARLMVGGGGSTSVLASLAAQGGATGGCSLWWHDRWNQHAPAALRCQGLPSTAAFAGFLDGDWPRHGWTPSSGGLQP